MTKKVTKLNYWCIREYDDGSKGLQGYIQDDVKCRFRDGEYVYTTPVVSRVNNVCTTRSGTEYTLGLHASLMKIAIEGV